MNYVEMIEEMVPYMKEYCKIVADGVNQRHPHLPKTKEGLVVGGLMARIATLTNYLMLNPASWTPNMAAFPFRTQVECYFTLAWILRNIDENPRRYVLDSIRRNKKNEDKRKEYISAQENEPNSKNNDSFLKQKERIGKDLAMLEEWNISQMAEWKIDVSEIANKKEKGLPQISGMAKDAGLLFDYYDLYAKLSVFSHNSWFCVSFSNTQLPDDEAFQIPVIGKEELGVFIMRLSAKYLTRAYQKIDRHYDLRIDVMLPEEYWKKHESDIKGILGV